MYFNCHFGRFISKRWKEYCMKINFVIIINLVFTTYVCKNRTFFNPKEVICGPDHPVASGGRHIFHADTAHRCRTRHHQQSGADCYRVAHAGSARSGTAYHVSYRNSHEQRNECRRNTFCIAFRTFACDCCF